MEIPTRQRGTLRPRQNDSSQVTQQSQTRARFSSAWPRRHQAPRIRAVLLLRPRSPQVALGIHPVPQAPPKCGDLQGQAGRVSWGVRAQPGSSHWEVKLEQNQMEVPLTTQEGTSHPALCPQAGCHGNTWIWGPGARLSVLTLAWAGILLRLQMFI